MLQFARFTSSRNIDRAKLIGHTEGGTAIEYALIGAIIALGLVAGLKNLKYGLTGGFDRISLQIQRVNNDTSGTRLETSRADAGTYYADGFQVNQTWIYYDDGSVALYKIWPNPGSGLKSALVDYGKDNTLHGGDAIREDGSLYSERYEQIRNGVMNVTTVDGNQQRSFIHEQIILGGGYYGYRTTMNTTNVSNDWVSGYSVVYVGVDSNGIKIEKNIGSTLTYQNGLTVNYGGDISQYR